MGILKKLFGQSAPWSDEELIEDVKNLIREAGDLAETDPRSAAKMLKKKAELDIEKVIDFGAPLFNDYADVVLRIIGRLRSLAGKAALEITSAGLPSVLPISDDEVETYSQIAEAARNSDADIVYVRVFASSNHGLNALLAIEALYEFATAPGMKLIFFNTWEHYFLIRREFLLALDMNPEGDTEETCIVLAGIDNWTTVDVEGDAIKTTLGNYFRTFFSSSRE